MFINGINLNFSGQGLDTSLPSLPLSPTQRTFSSVNFCYPRVKMNISRPLLTEAFWNTKKIPFVSGFALKSPQTGIVLKGAITSFSSGHSWQSQGLTADTGDASLKRGHTSELALVLTWVKGKTLKFLQGLSESSVSCFTWCNSEQANNGKEAALTELVSMECLTRALLSAALCGTNWARAWFESGTAAGCHWGQRQGWDGALCSLPQQDPAPRAGVPGTNFTQNLNERGREDGRVGLGAPAGGQAGTSLQLTLEKSKGCTPIVCPSLESCVNENKLHNERNSDKMCHPVSLEI